MYSKEKKKWSAFFIISLFFSTVLYIFYNYHILASPAPYGLSFILNHWWIIYLIEFLLPIILIHSFFHEPLSRYGVHLKQLPIQLLISVFLCLLYFILCHPYNFTDLLVIAFSHAQIHIKRDFCLSHLPNAGFFLAMLGQNTLIHGFYLTFFLDIFHYKIIAILLTSFLFIFSFYSSLQTIYEILFTFFYAFLYACIRILVPNKCTIFTLTFSDYLYSFLLSLL